MKKKRKIDFIIKDNNYEKIIFRFYPRSSTCHSFGEEPPKSWKEVYKVYYHYKIISIWKSHNEHRVLFDSNVDECSIIDEISNRIKLISDGATTYTWSDKFNENHTIQLLDDEVVPFGDGVSWTIRKMQFSQETKYSMEMYDWKNVGYRFMLNATQFKEFGEYLNLCCEYMLAHGDPI